MPELFASSRYSPAKSIRLKQIARKRLGQRSPGQTLDTSGLIAELYLRLVNQSQVSLHDRRHFFAYAAKAMRSIVIDHARRRAAAVHGGGVAHVALETVEVGSPPAVVDVLALEQALTALAAVDERKSRLVELRFFAGMTLEEAAALLGIAEKTARRDWQKARAFLYTLLDEAKE